MTVKTHYTKGEPTIIFIGLTNNTGIKVMSVNTGKVYQLWTDPKTGKMRCSCPHHLYRKATCKHIQAYLNGDLDNALEEF